jgi:hypothetical protein
MRKSYSISLITILVLTLPAAAIVPPKDDTLHKSRPEWVQAPELSANPSLDRVERGNSRAIDFPGVAKFFADNSSDWNVTWDTRSNRAHLVQGPGVEWSTGGKWVSPKAGGLQLDDVAAQARAFMSDNTDLFNIDQADLVLDESQSGTFGDRDQLTFVTFQQIYEGLDVEGATVFFRLNSGKLRSFGTVRVAELNLNTRANVDKADALQRVLDHAGFLAGDVTELLNDGELKIVPTLPPGNSAGHAYVGAPGNGYRHALVREISFRRVGDAATYGALVDARSGRVLELVDQNDYATVKGGVMFGFYSSTLDIPELKSEVVQTFPSNTTTTSGPCTQLNGANIRMSDNCGSINVCDASDATPGNGIVDMGTGSGSDCTTPGFGGSGNTRSSRSGFYHLTSIRNTASGFHPTNSWLNSKVTSNMNINNTCNAYWDGSSVNFYRSGGGCGNTGEIAAVFLHEWGHGFDTNTGGSASDQASGEAVGDTFAALYLQDSCIGWGFQAPTKCHNCTSCTGVRDLNDFSLTGTKTRATPANIKSNTGINCDRWACPNTGYMGPMGYEGHCEAIIAGSAVWNLAQVIGYPATEKLWYDSLIPSKSAFQVQSGGQCNTSATVNGCGANNWYTVFQAVDTAGNAGAIWDAFDAQGIACGSRPSGSNVLTNGVANTGNAATTGNQLNFTMPTTAGTGLVFTTAGSNGDADLYVKFGSAPTTSSYDCRSWTGTSNETCNIGAAQAGTYYVMVHAYSSFTGLSVLGSYTPTVACGPYSNTINNISGSTGSWYRTTENIACTKTMTVTISGGSGDADLYVRKTSNPTLSTYDCRPWLNGNNETCVIAATAGAYQIGIYAYSTYSGVSLTTSY